MVDIHGAFHANRSGMIVSASSTIANCVIELSRTEHDVVLYIGVGRGFHASVEYMCTF